MIVFIVAKECEAKLIASCMTNMEDTQCNKIYKGEMEKFPVTVVVSGSGQAEVAEATQKVIEDYKPDVIINIGTAGVLNSAYSINTVYGIKSCAQFFFNTSQTNQTVSSNKVSSLSTIKNYPLGSIATVDNFVKCKSEFKLVAEDTKADFWDMESSVIVQECDKCNVPVYVFKILTKYAYDKSMPSKQKRKYVELINNNIKRILIEVAKEETLVVLGGGWDIQLAELFKKPYYQEIREFLKNEYNSGEVFPDRENIFNCFRYTPFKDVKCVILGQDPYPNPGQAQGLSFSVPRGMPLPDSLKNIFEEIYFDTGIVEPADCGDLTNWAERGVLLLNSTLTVRNGVPNSHSKCGWTKFTDDVLGIISDKKEHVVFILWGGYAARKKKLVDKKKHEILMCKHPSDRSKPHKKSKNLESFFGARHFSKTNTFLLSHAEYYEEDDPSINWDLNESE